MHIENNVVVNNFIDIDVIEEKTDKKVVVHEAKQASNPAAAGKTEGETVAIFDAEVKEDPVAKPKKVTKVEEVEKKKQALAIEEPELEKNRQQQAKKSRRRRKRRGRLEPPTTRSSRI